MLSIILGSQQSYAESLDLYYSNIKSAGSLREFCLANPIIDECKIAIGEWKPAQLEKVKTSSPQCFNTCPLDTFGFVRSADGAREFPRVSTKDFDGSSPSRGVEFDLYPVVLTALKYEGCTGCPLIKTSPLAASISKRDQVIELPLLGYGSFYLPTKARSLLAARGREGASVDIILDFGKNKEKRRISGLALREYAKMQLALNYHLLR